MWRMKVNMSIQESLKITDKDGIALLEWDHIGESANKLSTPIMTRFREILEEIKTSNYKALVIISRKKKIFIAGADIDEIKNLKTKDLAALTKGMMRGGGDNEGVLAAFYARVNGDARGAQKIEAGLPKEEREKLAALFK